ncbi:MAG TPA: hypothetical protein VMW47_04920 [Verrucomicrobiae bacterium]|nr:hypothetical protein [Verrucomicrobiae bacterium]
MTFTDYLITGLLISLVVRQIHGKRLTAFGLLWPIGLVAWAAVTYLHGIPTAGNDLTLTVAGVVVGLVLGTLCASFTTVRVGPDAVAVAQAGWLAALLWILGMASRMTFAFYAQHGGGRAIGSFSAAHGITGAQAWVAALIVMAIAEVLGRTAVLAWRAQTVRQALPATGLPSVG